MIGTTGSDIILTLPDVERMLAIAQSQRARRMPFLTIQFLNDTHAHEKLPRTNDIYKLS
jgi:hypothetical protein